MNLVFQFLYLLLKGLAVWLIVTSIRDVWQKSPENPTRIFLAEFAAGIVFVSLLFLWAPLFQDVQDVINDKREIVSRIITVPAGINKVKRGQFVVYSDKVEQGQFVAYSRIRRLIALPNDELSVVNGIIHINGIQLGTTSDTFLPFNSNCSAVVIPPNHFATTPWLGKEPSSCNEIQVISVKKLQATCVVVFQPFSESCTVQTNNIPKNIDHQ